MQDDFDNLEFQTNYFLQRCIKLEEFQDYEIANEFLLLAPVAINDLYNQN
mgnify:CR=1 FL=1